jgi:hypothetical protein
MYPGTVTLNIEKDNENLLSTLVSSRPGLWVLDSRCANAGEYRARNVVIVDDD